MTLGCFLHICCRLAGPHRASWGAFPTSAAQSMTFLWGDLAAAPRKEAHPTVLLSWHLLEWCLVCDHMKRSHIRWEASTSPLPFAAPHNLWCSSSTPESPLLEESQGPAMILAHSRPIAKNAPPKRIFRVQTLAGYSFSAVIYFYFC